jgi:arylsulfatase A-like enzyme
MPEESRGRKSDALVELIDMYPTLCELAGISKPDHLEGCSFTPLLLNPGIPWKTAAFSQFPTPALREWGSIALRPGMRETYFGPLIREKEAQIAAEHKWNKKLFEEDLTGYAMRTERYRLIAWKDTKNMKGEPICVELFDHREDPLETRNIAKDNPELVNRLLKQLDAGWKASLPK